MAPKNLPTTEVVRNSDGTISLPPEARFKSHEALREWSERMEQEEDEIVLVDEPAGSFLDGLVALPVVLKRLFGLVSTESYTVPGPFGPVHRKPEVKSITIGHKKTVQVPWGGISVPALSGNQFNTAFALDERIGPELRLQGKMPRRFTKVIKLIADETRQEIDKQSIFRGKAYSMDFSTLADNDRMINKFRRFGPNGFAPDFMDLSHVNEKEVVFSSKVQKLIESCLFTPIRKWDLLKKLGSSPKRGVLLEGKPGVGKTMTAKATAKVATENGWTFVYVKEPEHLATALAYAKRYQPAVVFCEDVDRLLTADEKTGREEGRNADANALLNTVSGVDSDSDVLMVLTTNFVEKIQEHLPELLRPGRLDAVIKVEPPDAIASMRLIRQYGRGTIKATEAELLEVGRNLAGNNPAVIREVVDRARLFTLAHSDDPTITVPALHLSAQSMEDQIKMLQPTHKKSKDLEVAEALGEKLGSTLAKGILQVAEQVVLPVEQPKLTDGGSARA